MPFPPVWAVLFFFMVLIVALDSEFVCVEGCITAIMDEFQPYLRFACARELVSAAVCVSSLLLGLTMVTEGGIYIFQIFDYYAASGVVLLSFCFVEVIAISWVYGVDRWHRHVEDMVQAKVSAWLKICWVILTPGASMVYVKKR